jgi:hypothetical protein
VVPATGREEMGQNIRFSAMFLLIFVVAGAHRAADDDVRTKAQTVREAALPMNRH